MFIIVIEYNIITVQKRQSKRVKLREYDRLNYRMTITAGIIRR